MIITAIERIARRRNRVQVFLDGVAGFELPAAVADREGLQPGRSLEPGELDALLARESRRSAMETAAAMLSRRPRSERDIRRRLMQRSTEPAVVDETIERLRELDLIDDRAFAQSWAEARDRISPRGSRLIAQELRAAGVAIDIASVTTAMIDDDDAALRLARRRSPSLARLEYRAFRDRLASHLQRRGFGWESTRRAVEAAWREVEQRGRTETT